MPPAALTLSPRTLPPTGPGGGDVDVSDRWPSFCPRPWCSPHTEMSHATRVHGLGGCQDVILSEMGQTRRTHAGQVLLRKRHRCANCRCGVHASVYKDKQQRHFRTMQDGARLREERGEVTGKGGTARGLRGAGALSSRVGHGGTIAVYASPLAVRLCVTSSLHCDVRHGKGWRRVACNASEPGSHARE